MPIRRKPLSTDTIIAIAATVTSICALVVAVYQTKLTREQQLNSVWPYLLISEVIDENEQFTIGVFNYGIGPAIIDSVKIDYKGKSYSSPIDVIKVISKALGRGDYGLSRSGTTLSKGYIIPQGQSVSWFSVNGKEDNAIFRKTFPDWHGSIYYHSIYNEHWHSNMNGGGEVVVED